MRLRRLYLLTLVLSTVLSSIAKEDEVDQDFWFACSGGKTNEVAEYLQARPDWVNACTPDGESCLHLAAIPGSAELTKLLLDLGADPNVRSTFKGGLRMHPLSWNIYGGHYESIKLLLEHGAEVNADIDSGDGSIITVLDANSKFLEGEPSPHAQVYEKVQALLLRYGAKTYEELQKDL